MKKRSNNFLRNIIPTLIILLILVLDGYSEAAMVNYRIGGKKSQALLYRPKGKGPFPVVVYNHGMIVDLEGYQGANEHGYKLENICRALAADGFLVFAPIRKSARMDYPAQVEEVSQAIDYVKTLPDADSSRIALMGFSRGAGLALSVGMKRTDLRALIIMAIGRGGRFHKDILQQAPALNVPVLLQVAADDVPNTLKTFDELKRTLQEHGKEVRAIRYEGGGGARLFWDVGDYLEDTVSFINEKLGR